MEARQNDRRTEKTAYLGASDLALFAKYDQVKEDETDRACSMNGVKRNAYRLLVGKPDGKGLLGRPKCRWVDNSKMDLREIGWVVWSGLICLRIGLL
jgi:hypothetical protein